MAVECQHAGHSSTCRMAHHHVGFDLQVSHQFGHACCHAGNRKQRSNVFGLWHGGKTMARKINGDHGVVVTQQGQQVTP